MVRDRFFFENVSTGLVVLGVMFMTPPKKGNKQAPIEEEKEFYFKATY
jgi:hypothetical protein